ncbi:MAG: amidase domain-containing protein, partial [Oscillospiraceae bacterium]|nr:amidase domain-containing protein [Oscillospiraceae bacterium]
DPKDEDTDDDTLLDGDEIALNLKYGLVGNQSLDPRDPISDKVTGDQYRTFDQTVTVDIKSADEVINGITVDIDNIPGYLDNAISVESVMGIDVMSSEVVGLMGEPYDFSVSKPEFGPSENSPATLTFDVDMTKLGETDFNNITVFWFDEENKRYEKMPTNRNSSNGTISAETTHFSEYMLVDKEKWDNAWEKCFEDITSQRQKNAKVNTVFVFDSSVKSKGDTDSNPEGAAETERLGDIAENRRNACKTFIGSMKSGDKAAIVSSNSDGYINVVESLTENRDVLINGVDSITMKDNSRPNDSLNKAANILLGSPETDTVNHIIYITDGYDDYSISNSTISKIKNNDISIYAMVIGGYEVTTSNLYRLTDNIYYYTDLLVKTIGGKINYVEEYLDISDTDKDGIPDIIENNGLQFNGRPISTDPIKFDTDDDTLGDGDELQFAYSKEDAIEKYEDYIAGLITISNPTLPDSDGDGLGDNDENKLKTNPLTITKYCRYDKNKAINYALKWYDDYNNEYDNFDGDFFGTTFDQISRKVGIVDSSDCTNFTSQCLYAGGISMTDTWYSHKTGDKYNNIMTIIPDITPILMIHTPTPIDTNEKIYDIKYDVTSSWCFVDNQLQYFETDKYSEGIEIITKENLDEITASGRVEIGDLMYFNNSGEGDDYSHSAIVSKINEEKKICYAGHSNPQSDKSLSKYFVENPDGKVKIVKIKKVIILE